MMTRKTRKYPFVRFHDLDWSAINCDLQVHTNWTDGQEDIATLLQLAVERNVRCIAFTEHVRRETDWFARFAQAVRQARVDYPEVDALVGCEAKALDTHGQLDASDSIVAECDIVLGSVHRFPDGAGGYVDFSTLSPEQMAHTEFVLAMGLLHAAPIDVLAHPGGMYFRRFGDFPADLMHQLMTKSLERQIAIEINTSYLGDPGHFLQLCADINPYVSIGSDVHHRDDLGNCRDMLKTQEYIRR